jgi:hypothetical protein
VRITSMWAARRAGMMHATVATAASVAVITTSTRGSDERTTMGFFGKDEAETATVRGKPFPRQAGGNDTFWQKRAQLHGAVLSLFDLEWASPTCDCLVCSACGYVHWFLPQA